jgi:repressor LexA
MADIAELTRSQLKTLEFIRSFIAKHNYAPTNDQIATGIDISSRGVAYRNVKALREAGFIDLTPKRHRNIQLTEDTAALNTIPLVGRIAAGEPIEAVVDNEMIDVSSIFLGENRYALRVCGDSMIDEGILDGDLVVCRRADIAQSGQIVVALVDQSQATLKRISFPGEGMVRLLPANRDYLPQEYPSDRVQVQGIYLGLLRLPA